MASGKLGAGVFCVLIQIMFNMDPSLAVRHGRNLIWAQTDEGLSGVSRIVSIEGDPDRWVPNKTASTRFITAPSNQWRFSGLAYDYRNQKLFWSDTGNKRIQGFLLNGTDTPFTIFDGISSGVRSLDLDWLTGNVYWADSRYNWIVMAPAVPNTSLFRVVISTGLDQPMGVVVHPLRGLLFWSDWGAVAKIERSDTRGLNRRLLVSRGLSEPMGLALDMTEDRLYWVDRDRGTIESVDIFGRGRKIHFTVEDTQFVSIALYHNYLFVTDQQDRLLYTFNRKSGGHEVNFNLGSAKPSSVIMYDRESQTVPDTEVSCDVMKCAHMCVSTHGGSVECVCASGYDLQPDGISCVDDGKYPTPMFVYSIGNALCRFPGNLPDMSLEGVTLDTQCFMTNRKTVLAIGANVRENLLYFAENETKTISKVKLAQGESPQIIIGGTGTVQGLAIDWIANNLYWSDSVVRKIMVAREDGRYQRALHEDLDIPRGLAVDSKHRYLYWTDVGSRPRIERSLLDGSQRHVFVDDDVTTPNHINIDYRTERIFWTDSGRGYIASVDFKGRNRKTIIRERGASFFGVTLFQDFLVWTETGHRNGIHAGLAESGSKVRGIVHPGVGRTNDVITFDASAQPLANGPCDSAHRCQQLCLPGSDSRSGTCACAMGLHKSPDQKSCLAAPFADNFLLFADTYRKQIYQMDMRTGDFRAIPLSGHDNPVSVTFDPTDRKLYWSDVTAKVLKRALLNGTEEEIVKLLPSDSVPDGIAIDPVSRLLFYTDAGSGSIAALTLAEKYHVTLIVDDLDKPRAIALDAIMGYMYWTDWSDDSRIEKAEMDGSGRRVIVHTGIDSWPNGLTIDSKGERLYWCDARSERVESTDLEGGGRRVIYRDPRAHFFGITLSGATLYYTDWNKRTIMKLEKVGSRYSSTAIGQAVFARANDIHAYKLDTYTRGVHLTACSVRKGGCSHVCIPVPEGRKCACPDGLTMNADLLTCSDPTGSFTGQFIPTPGTVSPGPSYPPSLWREPVVKPREREDLVLYQHRSSTLGSTTESTSMLTPTETSGDQVSNHVTQDTDKLITSSKDVSHISTANHRSSLSTTPTFSTFSTNQMTSSYDQEHVTSARDLQDSSRSNPIKITTSVLDSTETPDYTSIGEGTEEGTALTPGGNLTSRDSIRKNNTETTNTSDITILDSKLSYVTLGSIVVSGGVVMLLVVVLAIVFYKKCPRKQPDRDNSQTTSSHVPNFHVTYEMPLHDTVTSSHPSAERLTNIANGFYPGSAESGLENPSFVRRESRNTIYEEIPGYSGGKTMESPPSFTTFTKAASELDSQFDYLTDNYVLANGKLDNTSISQTEMDPYAVVQRANKNMHTTIAHVHTHAHQDAVDAGNYHVIQDQLSSSFESSFSLGECSQQSDHAQPPVPEKSANLLKADDVYATISRAKRPAVNAGIIAAAIEQHHLLRQAENH